MISTGFGSMLLFFVNVADICSGLMCKTISEYKANGPH